MILSIAISTCSSTLTFGLICVVSMFSSSESVLFMKKPLNMFAILKSSVNTCQFSTSGIPVLVCTFPEKRGFIAFQKFQLSDMSFRSRFLSYCSFVLRSNFKHSFLLRLKAFKFSSLLSLLNLLRNFDRCIIASVLLSLKVHCWL